ncbi:MAG: adenosine deaminase [Candidatus Limnocylindrales bacterium]
MDDEVSEFEAGSAAAHDAHDLFARMPKAELHLHLDGSLRPATTLELARERGLDAGLSLEDMAARLQAPAQVTDQAQLLEAFDLPIAIMQDVESISRITHELVLDVASDGTRYAEIRWAPALHVMGGLSLGDSIQAVVDGMRSGVGATGVHVRLIAVALRSHPPETSVAVAEEAARFVGDGLTGFDLAGQEAAFPDPLLHAAAYGIARSAGLGITIHAGEWGGAAQVWRALSVDPWRIAHGSRTADDPVLMTELAYRNVTLDLCPTSNVQASIYPSLANFPLDTLAGAGVPVTLSTDDRTVSDLTLIKEYDNAHDVMGMSVPELWAINMHALRVAFLHDDESLRAALIDEFEAFAASEPALTPR